ncbi:PREDICTED: U-box [Prunus dulcis]|uniref:PREDICTED: U-box n=1 Tax=Prunus dulcis TaxID=3755 RepID=A0A5E4FUD8_PRUDU|nr:U-box domain-containing protein 35 [Prunus dulcis]VVA31039.1 PREDICTED: U-box [Prunus dulcis]
MSEDDDQIKRISSNNEDDEYYYRSSSCNISSCEIEEDDEEEVGSSSSSSSSSRSSSRRSTQADDIPKEIKELFGNKRYLPMPSIKEDYTDNHHDHRSSNSVYVGVGKSESSMEALTWTLKHAADPSSTTVYLIHVFPEIHFIPSPLGKLPKSQVSSQQVETYMAQETGKRRELLHKFLDKCSAANVKVDTVLIESDMIARAILDLIPILNITTLVLGTTKSNLRKLMSGKGSGIADQILQAAPDGCEIKIICQGNQVMMDQAIHSLSPRLNDDPTTTKSMQHQQQRNNIEAFSCICFKPKFSSSS